MVQYSGGGGAQAGVQGGYAPLDSGLHVPLQYLNGITPTQLIAGAFPRGLLQYAQITAPLPTSSGTPVDATGLSLTVTLGTRPVKITFWTEYAVGTTANGRGVVSIYDVTAGAQVTQGVASSNASSNGMSLTVIASNYAPGAGSRTFKCQFWTLDAGTFTLNAGATFPTFLQVEEM